MTTRKPCAVFGKWRLTESDQWDRDYLDLVEPAYIHFTEDGRGEMVFGAVQVGLTCKTSPSIIFFSFEGSDEMDPVHGTGSAELTENAELEVEISFAYGDEAQLKARRW